jgi:hypothetical protein
MRSVLRLQEKLEALLEDEDTTEPEKEEIQRQLIDLYAYEKKRGPRVRDSAAKASDAVGRAISRLQKRLTKAVQADGTPDRTVRSFGELIYKRILRPSGRARRPGGVKLSRGTGGFFRYLKKP